MHISEKNFASKAGVSLITVLLFMLIATIAATATWKWITSEGSSSTTRMLQREAYQSAEAGIGATRAWMMHHGNDVGALIKQYQDGNNVPVKIDGQLAEFKAAGQSYDVWLTGVNTETTPYKLKILSKGVSRNGQATYTEAAILNVDGLYKVKIPSNKKSGNFKFDYNYFGGSMENHGTMNSTSLLINGNWKGNPNNVSEAFVVTGNAELLGNNLHVGKIACIGGNLSSNNGFTGTNLYVEKNANSFTAKMAGDVYFNGSVRMGSQAIPGFNIAGNVFLKDTMVTDQGAVAPVIHGNMCFDEDAILVSAGTNNPFIVKSNAWLPGPFNVAFGSVDWSSGKVNILDAENIDQNYNKIIFADSTGMAYVKYGREFNDYASIRTERSFNQHTDWNKQCQSATVYGGGWGGASAVCAQMKQGGWNWEWNDKWETWSSGSYSPYAWTRTSAGNKYFLYYTENVKDVDYKTYTRNDLMTMKYHSGPGLGPGIGPGGIGPGGSYVAEKSTIGAYYVGGQPFYYQDLDITYNYGYGYGYGGQATANLTPYYRGYHFDCIHHGMNNSCEDGYIEGSPYCKKISTEGLRPFCSVPSWFQVTRSLSTSDPTDLDCGESVVESCDSIWHKGNGCDGSDYKVDDILKNSYDVFNEYAKKGCAANITEWGDDVVTKMNDCHASLSSTKPDDLFNGYLVVSVKSIGKKDPAGTLNGKFIIIFENDPGQNGFPPTESDSYVFLYLRKGGSSTLQPTGAGTYNYFIFTDEYVDGFLFNNTATLSGSIYAKAENCARVKDMTIDNMVVNQDLLNDLVTNGVLCPYEATDCGTKVSLVASSSSTTSSTSTTTSGTFGSADVYYISSAPQLKISLESQYKSDESEEGVKNASSLGGSFIVLPRVVYITKDPKGELKDYYGLIPLNSKLGVTENSVTCNESSIKTTGDLYDASTGPIKEGYYKCDVSGTVGTSTSTVPFFLVVKGTLGNAQEVNFEETSVELSKGNSTNPTITLDAEATQPYSVKIAIPTTHDGWTVTPINGTSCNTSTGICEATIATGSQSVGVFTVTNDNASSGSVIMQIVDCDACQPGNNSIEQIYVSASANVYLSPLSEYCQKNPSECPAGSELAKQANTSEWPDCPEEGIWISVATTSSDGCKTMESNHYWVCAIDGDVTLDAKTVPAGCQVVIPSQTLDAPLEPKENYDMYAGLKAIKQSLYVGFAGNITDGDNKSINVVVLDNNGNVRNKTCTYTDFHKDPNNCIVDVYRGSKVTLEVPGSPTDFNRWKCEAGNDCADLTNFNQTTVSFVISGSNKVYAHFNEDDQHCFFDEFKLQSLDCDDSEKYCITSCKSNTDECKAGAKWKLVEGSLTDLQLDTYDKKLKLKNTVTRGKKESEMPKVTVLSTVEAGLYGTLKTQFKIPKLSTSNKNIAQAAVKNTGFILRGSGNLSSYLMLNVYLDDYNIVHARLCLNGGNACMESPLYNEGVSAYANDGAVVLVSATIKGLGKTEDTLVVTAIPSLWSSTAYKTEFVLNSTNMNGVEALKAYGVNETVGYRIGDPGFELYGIGWYSEDNNAECWDTYPTVKCSFKANYAGGIVPKETDVAPWVGLSAWYDQGYGMCEPHYYYNGTDGNCNGAALTGSTEFLECGSSYKFTETGSHGTDKRKAAAAVHDCGLSTESGQWASVTTECGPFWVGDYTICTESYTFAFTSQSNAGGEYWNAPSKANLRDATLKIVLSNEAGDEYEISMFSQNDENSFTYGSDPVYSQTFKTKANGEISIPVSSLSNVEGFDPENVGGVYIHNLTGGTLSKVTSVMTTCPNVLSIDACYADYSTTSGGWKIQALVNNADRAGKITVAAGGTASTTNLKPTSPLICGDVEGNACSWSGSGKSRIAVFSWEDDPYSINSGKEYQFTVSLTSSDGKTTVTPCVTDPYPISDINAECSLKKNSVVSGGGIPVVEYSLSGCPDNKCGYEIYVVENNTIIAQNAETDNFTNLNTSAMVMNTSTEPLEKGDYTVKMRQKDTKRPFTEKTCGTFEVTDVTQQESEIRAESCSFDGASITLGGYTKFVASDFSGTDQSAAVKLLDPDGNEVSSHPSFWTGGNYEVWNIVPSKVGTLTYTLIVNGGRSCTANLTVAAPSGTCSFSKSSLNQGEKLRIQVGSITPQNSNVKLDVVKVAGNDSSAVYESSSYWTGNTYSQDFDMDDVGTFTYKVKVSDMVICSQEVTVAGLVPAVTCPSSDQYFAVNSDASFKASTLTNCDNGCNYTLKAPDGTVIDEITDGTYTSRTQDIEWTAPATAGDTTYKLVVYNKDDATLKDSCNVDVVYNQDGSGGCYEIEWTPNTGTTPSNSGGGTWAPALPQKAKCFEINMSGYVCTGNYQLKMADCKGETINWNGASVTLKTDNDETTGTVPNPNAVISISSTDECTLSKLYMEGCSVVSNPSAVPQISGCPTNTITTWPNTSVTIPVTVSNCNVLGGCSYTISPTGGTDITGTTYGNTVPSFVGSTIDNTTISYSLSVSNSLGSATSCSFSVKYDSNARINQSVASNTVLGPGKYKLTCYGNSGNKTMQPYSASAGSNCKSWFDPDISWNAGADYGGCSGQASVTFPINLDVPSGETITLTCW